MAAYTRPKEGFRYIWGGVSTKTSPDALPPNKYTVGQNIRAYSDSSIRTRPGYQELFNTQARVTDIRAYSALNTDDYPHLLARNSKDEIWLENGTKVGQMAKSGMDGVSMVPYRPNQSPNPWMYIASNNDYQKFSAPPVQQQKVGIAEPQTNIDACPEDLNYTDFSPLAAGWTPDGVVAGATSDITRVTDTVGVVIADPKSLVGQERYSVQVSNVKQFNIGMTVKIATVNYTSIVQDILPPINIAGGITIAAIYYFVGTTGRCLIVPSQGPIGPGIPTVTDGNPNAESIFSGSAVASFRRGSLININNGGGSAEIVFVDSVTTGPGGTLCLEVVTTNTHAAGETVEGVPALVLDHITGSATGHTISSPAVSSTFGGAGIGTLTATLGTNPFNSVLSSPSTATPQEDDYLHFSLNISDLTQFIQGSLVFDINGGSADYISETFYYLFDISNIVPGFITDLTPVPASTWYEFRIPIRSLIRSGSDITQTLANTQAMRLSIEVIGGITLEVGAFSIQGGGNPDVGDNGSPYFYTAVPRASETGAIGNPAPLTRYGVSPRRQSIMITLPSTYFDPQMDTWDIYRYGGTVNSFRRIGSAPISAGSFQDIYFDDSTLGGSVIDYTNFEPWPTIDLPFSISSGVDINSINWTITLIGTVLIIQASKANKFANPFSQYILDWLPGTEITIGGQQTYNLWNRPIAYVPAAPPAHYYAYLFNLVENAGFANASSTLGQGPSVYIIEPNVANQHMPYVFGPDAYGTIFAVGDPLRPGNFSWCKAYAPNSAPDTNNYELTNPSEPLLGGEVVDGVAYISSSSRWWKLIFQPGNIAQPYYPVEIPVGRALAAVFGHCTDGKTEYFWTKDGIASHSGGAYKSLTDADLLNIFPHDGIQAVNVFYAGFVWTPPDYSKTSQFRLTYCNSYLYADYVDIGNAVRTIVLDLRTGGWSQDSYADPIGTHYCIPNQEGSVVADGTFYPVLVMGDTNGLVHQQHENANDNGTAINGAIGTFEYDGGDIRSFEQWGDIALSILPAGFNIIAQPLSNGLASAPITNIPQGTTRTQEVVSLSGGVLQDFLGLLTQWTDDFTQQTSPTTLYFWQPSFIEKPEIVQDRFGDWDNAGTPDAKFFQGFIAEADTFNKVKGVSIRNGDSQAVQQTFSIQHNGQQTKPYSFTTPFIAHSVRYEPQDEVPWREFGVKWVFEPTPESVLNWITQGTSFGMKGYSHIREIMMAYASTAPITLTITVNDGTSPSPITLPSTNGQYQKMLFPLTANKGLLYFFRGVSAQPWQPFLNACEVRVGNWGRSGEYLTYTNIGAIGGDQSRI